MRPDKKGVTPGGMSVASFAKFTAKFWPSRRTAAGGTFVGKEASRDRAALLPGGGMTGGDGGKSPDTDGGMTLGAVAVRSDGGATAGADGTTTLDATGGVTWGTTAGGNGTTTCGGAEGLSLIHI